MDNLFKNNTLLWNETFDQYTNQTNATFLPPTGRLPEYYYYVLVACLTASIICLIATIAIYLRVPDFKNVPGCNLVTLSTALLVTYCFLIADFMLRRRIAMLTCKALASFTHFSFLGMFMWTNVMSYDIFQTVNRAHELGNKPIKYWKYSVYAWSATIALAAPAIIVDSFKLVGPESIAAPNFGSSRCWLSGKTAFLIYFNAPVGIIIIGNIILYALTAKALIKMSSMTVMLKVKQQHKQRFVLYLKLLFVMGMVWIFEFLPWITGIYKLYALAGLLTSLYGVFLFAIFICKRNVWLAIKKLHTNAERQVISSNEHYTKHSQKNERRSSGVTSLAFNSSSTKINEVTV